MEEPEATASPFTPPAMPVVVPTFMEEKVVLGQERMTCSSPQSSKLALSKPPLRS